MDNFNIDVDLFHVHTQLAECYTLEELETLCFALSVKYEDLPANTLTGKCRELVKYCHRFGRLDQLVEHCSKMRPDVDWNKPPSSKDVPQEFGEPLEQLYALVKAFNRNRALPFSDARTFQGDDIAFRMREMAPFLFGQFDVQHWLNSSNAGKRLVAIKYLDWLGDVEYLDNLLGKLTTESPFMQLHALVAIDGMLDQLDSKRRTIVKARLTAYNILRNDASLEFWKKRILSRLA
jgi:hypothetical protein